MSKPTEGGELSPQRAICATCLSPIDGPRLTATSHEGQQPLKFHPGHFLCAYCRQPLSTTSTFKEHMGKPYCRECFKKLYSGFATG